MVRVMTLYAICYSERDKGHKRKNNLNKDCSLVISIILTSQTNVPWLFKMLALEEAGEEYVGTLYYIYIFL